MRIGFVTHEYPPEIIGGAGTYAHRLVTNLGALGYQVVVFTPLSNKKPDHLARGNGVKIVPLTIPGAPLSMAFFWLKLRRAIKSEEKNGAFDVIHINSPTLWFPFSRKISKAPQVLTIHHIYGDSAKWPIPGKGSKHLSLGDENGRFARFLEGRCVRLSDHIIAVSEYTRGRLEERYGPMRKTIHVIHEAPEPIERRLTAPSIDWRQRLSLGSKAIILFVGRINDPRKGLDILLDALARVDRNDYVLLIAGSGDPTPVTVKAGQLGIEDKIRLLGFVDSNALLELYDLCAFSVFPSQMEGFGLPVLDAAAAGKRVIATRVGAIPEIGGPGAILVEPNDPIALAEAIGRALDAPGPPSDLLRSHASKFNWSDVAQLTVAVYERALGKAHKV